VCILEVVAPPINKGMLSPALVNSFALKTISSKEGVIKPERPTTSAFYRLHSSIIAWQFCMTPMSITL
jgi:hypothetical protein